MKRQPSNHQAARRSTMSSPPILFRPTWAEAYAFRSRTITQQATPDDPAPTPEIFTNNQPPDTSVPPQNAPAAIFTFSSAARRATDRAAENEADPETPRDMITCPLEATRHTVFAQTIILGEAGQAMRGQANLSTRAARHLFN